jgi:HEAT repeat protein
VPEAIGNLAKYYPEKVGKAIPGLLQNTTENKVNTTVIRWCAAYALAEIAKNNPKTREQLLPVFSKIIENEKKNGVRNVYVKVQKAIEKEKSL